MVASDGCAMHGILNWYASSCQAVDTSSTSRVRRLGTSATSSRWYPRCAVLPRPISTTSRMGLPLVGCGNRGLVGVVVGRFHGHLDVVRVALLETSRGDAYQFPAPLQL